jgi:hypothetical protein
LLNSNGGIEMVDDQVLIRGLALRLTVEQFKTLNAAYTLDEIRMLFGFAHNLLAPPPFKPGFPAVVRRAAVSMRLPWAGA